jgi:SAM-dependent methyltransferase
VVLIFKFRVGLDYNSVKFVLWAKNLGVSFDRTLTLGRLGLGCTRHYLTRAFRNFGFSATREQVDVCMAQAAFESRYVDQFLRFLGAQDPVSVDRSNFEGATLLHDLNEPFPTPLLGTFDLVLDGGTLEHIFNYPQALGNSADLVRVGGHFITITPATGQMGHGFYQFSPELFFRFFSPERGFRVRKMILFDTSKTDSAFYEVVDPALKAERTISAERPTQLAVLAQRIAPSPSRVDPPQQSDYVAVWEKHAKKAADAAPAGPSGSLARWRRKLNPYWPGWLRDLRDEFRSRWYWHRTLSAQKGLRYFEPLRNEDMYRERQSP